MVRIFAFFWESGGSQPFAHFIFTFFLEEEEKCLCQKWGLVFLLKDHSTTLNVYFVNIWLGDAQISKAKNKNCG